MHSDCLVPPNRVFLINEQYLRSQKYDKTEEAASDAMRCLKQNSCQPGNQSEQTFMGYYLPGGKLYADWHITWTVCQNIVVLVICSRGGNAKFAHLHLCVTEATVGNTRVPQSNEPAVHDIFTPAFVICFVYVLKNERKSSFHKVENANPARFKTL